MRSALHLSEFFEDVRKDASFRLTGPYNGKVGGILCFASAARNLADALQNEHVSAVIVPPDLSEAAAQASIGVTVARSPREAFFVLHNKLIARAEANLPEPVIAAGVRIASSARISPGAIICEGATIAEMAFIGPRCIVSEGAYVGEGAIVGVAGHFEQWEGKRRLRVEHGGWVRLGARSQVLAGAVVQKDVFAVETQIGDDSVLGPGVLLAHGVSIGARSVVTGGVTVAGYTKIGSSVWIGPGSTIGNKLEIGDGARIEIGSTVIQSVPAGRCVSGNFALAHTRHLRAWKDMNR